MNPNQVHASKEVGKQETFIWAPWAREELGWLFGGDWKRKEMTGVKFQHKQT